MGQVRTPCDELGALLSKLAGAHDVGVLQGVELVATDGVPELCREVC